MEQLQTNNFFAEHMEAIVQGAMMARFGKAITLRVDRDDTGAPLISFTLAKPGLLPTAIERAYFDGLIAGFRSAVGVLVERAPV